MRYTHVCVSLTPTCTTISWTNTSDLGTLIATIKRPPLACIPAPIGCKGSACIPSGFGIPINCSEIGWSPDSINSILVMKDGKTVLLFGVLHSGDLGIMTINDRTFWYRYTKDAAGHSKPTVPLSLKYALRSTDGGLSFDPNRINLDGECDSSRPSLACSFARHLSLQ